MYQLLCENVLASHSQKVQLKIPVASVEYFLLARQPLGTPKTVQVVATALGFLLELHSKLLFLKTTLPWDTGHRRIMLKLNWKQPPC